MPEANIPDLAIAKLPGLSRSGKTTPQKLLRQLRQRITGTADYNVWITLLDEQQLDHYYQRLTTLDPALPLYGIPFAIKDNIDLAGAPVLHGESGLQATGTES